MVEGAKRIIYEYVKKAGGTAAVTQAEQTNMETVYTYFDSTTAGMFEHILFNVHAYLLRCMYSA